MRILLISPAGPWVVDDSSGPEEEAGSRAMSPESVPLDRVPPSRGLVVPTTTLVCRGAALSRFRPGTAGGFARKGGASMKARQRPAEPCRCRACET